MVKFAGLVNFPAFLLVVGAFALTWLVTATPAVRRRWPGAQGEVAAVGVLTALFGLYFWRLLFERGVSVPRGGGDFNSFYYPLAAFAAAQVQSGHFPLWNPHLFAGAPFAADYQTGALYPPNLLVWATARPYTYGAFTATVIAHVWWASVATYGFARTLGLSRAAGVLAGAVFAYGGFMTAQLGHAPMIAVASWLPAILAALYRGRNGGPGGIAWAVLAGAGMAMAILAGHPQIALYVGLAAVAYVLSLAWVGGQAVVGSRQVGNTPDAMNGRTTLVRGSSGATLTVPATQTPRERWRDPALRHWAATAGRLAVFAIVAGGLAAPLLLPAAQLARRSLRAAIGYDGATEYSLRPVALVQLVLPKVFGDNPTNYFYSNIFSGETWGYVGVTTLVLAAVGVLRRFGPQRRFFAALGGVALLGALGPFTPLHGWLYGFVPGFDSIRAAGRLLVLVNFAAALLAAWGLDALLSWLREARTGDNGAVFGASLRRVRLALLLAVGALVLFVIPLFYSLVLGRDDPVGRPIIALDGLNTLLLLLAAAAGLLWATERRRVSPRTLAALVVLLVVFDVFAATMGFNPTTDDVQAGLNNETARRELRARAGRDPLFRVDSDDVSDRYQPSAPLLDGADSVSGAYNPLGLADYAALRERAQSSRSSALYGLLNVAYVAQPSDKPPPRDWTRAFAADRVTFYQPSRPPLPRAFVVGAAEEVRGPGPAFDRIKAPDFDPAKVVYLIGAAQPTDADPGASPAVVARGDTETVTVRVTTTGAGYLVLSDAYYPGWEATVNGRPTPVVQADLAFRAVYLLEGGDYTVVFRFVPTFWGAGWVVFALTATGAVLLLAGAAVFARRRR